MMASDEEDDNMNLLPATNIKTRGKPKDHCHIAYMLVLLQGIGMLLPWNFFITAHEYFEGKFENDEYAKNTFENAFSVGAEVSAALGILFNLYLTGRVSRSLRIVASLISITTCFVVTTIFVKVSTETWTQKFFIFTMVLIVIINFSSGIYQGTIFGITGAIGGRYIQSAMVGMGLGAILVAIASFISLAAGSNVYDSALGYFSTASVMASVCIVGYIVLCKVPVIKYHLKDNVKESEDKSSSTENASDNSATTMVHNDYSFASIWLILGKIYPMAFSVCFTFFVSLALMPAVVSNIKSSSDSNSEWNGLYFSTLVCFLIFNAGDMAGRVLAGTCRIVSEKGWKLPLLCFARVVFIPLLMYCNYQPRNHLDVVFHSDVWPIVFNTLMSVSNGYLASLCMMYGPQMVAEPYKETAGVIMQLFVSLGLSLGSAFSYVITDLI